MSDWQSKSFQWDGTVVQIIPFTSVGNLKFGDTRQEAREKLDCPFSSFRKVLGAEKTDAFDGLGLHLYYDKEGRLEFIEGFDPAELLFHGIKFLGRDLMSVSREMESIGFRSTEVALGLDVESAGIALFAPSGIVEGVAAHREGYYAE